MKRFIFLIFPILLCFTNITHGASTFDVERFTPYEPSFLIYQWTKDSDGVKDERALEAHYSFQYILFNCNLRFDPSNKCKHKTDALELSISYTGEFDFYAGTRTSGPVISRINNPAINLSYKLGESLKSGKSSVSKIGLHFEHRSNGQVADVDEKDDTSGKFLAQNALDSGDREYFDTISRGANFAKFSTRFHIDIWGNDSKDNEKCDSSISCFNFWVSYKQYVTDNSNITWGSLAGTDTSFKDYDLVKIIASDTFSLEWVNKLLNEFIRFNNFTLEAEYTFGNEFLNTDSVDANIVMPVELWGLSLPLLFRYHNGPMDRLSNYTKSYSSVGIGLYFTH